MCSGANRTGADGGRRAVTALRCDVLLAFLLIAAMPSGHRASAQSPTKADPEIARLAAQAQADLHDQKPALAAAEYQKILALDPDNIGAHSNLGLAYYLQDKFTLASGEFEIALRHEPDLWNIEALCGLSEARTGQNTNAIVHLEQAFQHLEEPSLRLATGTQLFSIWLEAGELNRAAALIDQLQQFDPKNVDVLYAAHQVYSLLADRAFLAMAHHDPDSARMYQLRGDRMAEIGNMQGAITAYRLAIARDPHLSGVHFALGEALSVSRVEAERAEAETEYRKALADNPLDEKAESRLGDIEMQRSNPQAASRHYLRALQLQPDDPDANEGYGMVLLALDSSQEARSYLSRAVQLDPTNVAAYYHLSQASRKAGDFDAAKREMDEFLKLKAEKDNLKRSFNDLPLQAARPGTQEQNEQSQPKTTPAGSSGPQNQSIP